MDKSFDSKIIDGDTCPYCKEVGTLVTESIPEFYTNNARQEIRCLSCNKNYNEIYTITSVEEVCSQPKK